MRFLVRGITDTDSYTIAQTLEHFLKLQCTWEYLDIVPVPEEFSDGTPVAIYEEMAEQYAKNTPNTDN